MGSGISVYKYNVPVRKCGRSRDGLLGFVNLAAQPAKITDNKNASVRDAFFMENSFV
jgi:hypothetical protein